MKPRILFVDDEENILSSMRLGLRQMRAKWDMSFAQGGLNALKSLEREPHDVIVTDMRMPGMDGSQLLKEVQRLYPESVRIVLSGYSEEESVLKTVELAHQYVSKPCRTADLIKVIEGTLCLRTILENRRLRSIITKLDVLPTLPTVYTRLVSALQQENSTLQELGDILSQDLAMAASIMKLANSAFFGLPARITSIHHAVNHLGGQTIRALVLSTHLFSTILHEDNQPFSVRMLLEHSLRVACFAKTLMVHENAEPAAVDDSFIAAMLHDIGKLVLAANMPEEAGRVLAMVRAENCPLHVAEKEVFGATHAEVGAYLLGLWGFNGMHLDAVNLHHTPQAQDAKAMSPQLAVCLANAFDHELVRINPSYVQRRIDAGALGGAGVADRIGMWRALCEQSLAEGKCHE